MSESKSSESLSFKIPESHLPGELREAFLSMAWLWKSNFIFWTLSTKRLSNDKIFFFKPFKSSSPSPDTDTPAGASSACPSSSHPPGELLLLTLWGRWWNNTTCFSKPYCSETFLPSPTKPQYLFPSWSGPSPNIHHAGGWSSPRLCVLPAREGSPKVTIKDPLHRTSNSDQDYVTT